MYTLQKKIAEKILQIRVEEEICRLLESRCHHWKRQRKDTGADADVVIQCIVLCLGIIDDENCYYPVQHGEIDSVCTH